MLNNDTFPKTINVTFATEGGKLGAAVTENLPDNNVRMYGFYFDLEAEWLYTALCGPTADPVEEDVNDEK